MSIYEPMSLSEPIEGVELQPRAVPRPVLPMPQSPPLKGKVPSLLWKPETPLRRTLMFVVALAITVGYYYFVRSYEAPANTGVDQNAYLVGAKLLLDTGSTALRPTDPFSFVGRMWFVTPWDDFYPKYPVGLAVIDATIIKLTGGTAAVYLRSPVATSLALLGIFLLARAIVGSFGGLMSMLALGFSPITLQLADNPNSHATSLCLVTWGFFFLVRWWQDRGYWRAALAGFLIGYATGVRYTEGLLGLPVLIACITNISFKRLQTWAESFILGAFWTLPVALLFAYNLAHFGTLSGYDSTNESTGFSWPNFWANWEPMVRELYQTGLFFILPLGVAGIVMLLFKSWRIGLMLLTWAVPSILIYTAYYWDPPGQSITQIGYMRFFETVLPPLIVGAFWVVSYAAAPLWRDPRMPGGIIDSTCRWLLSLRCDPDSLIYAGLFKNIWARTISVVGVVSAHLLRFISPFLGTSQLAAIAVGGGVLTFISAGIGAYEVVGQVMQPQLYNNLGVAEATDMITHQVHVDGMLEPAGIPKGSLVFVDNDNLLNDLQFVGDYTVYTNQAFTSTSVRTFNTQVDNGQPMLFQIERTEKLKEEVGKLTDAQLAAKQLDLIARHYAQGVRSFWIVPRTQFNAAATGVFPNNAKLRTRLVAIWTEQVPFPPMEVAVNTAGGRGGGGGAFGGGGGRGAGRGALGGGRGARGGLGGIVAGGPGGGPGGPGGFGGRGGGRGRGGGGGLGIVNVQQVEETPAPPVIWQVIELIPPNAPAPQPILARPAGSSAQPGPKGGRGSYSNGVANSIAASPPSLPVNIGASGRGGRVNNPPSVVTPVPVPPTVRPPAPAPSATRGPAATRAARAAVPPTTNRATLPNPARPPAPPTTAPSPITPAATQPQRPTTPTTAPAGP